MIGDARYPPKRLTPQSMVRRAFLAKAGRAALTMPIATTLIVAATSKPVRAGSPYGGRSHSRGHGRGYGRGGKVGWRPPKSQGSHGKGHGPGGRK